MVRVENTGKGKLNLHHGVSLAPGVNEVDSAAWDKCKQESLTQHYLGQQIVKVVSGSSVEPTVKPKASAQKPEVEPGTQSLSGMKAKDAISYVGQCEDFAALEEWLDMEDRSTVVSAIEKRLQQLEEDD
jgi:hypothetical protein